MSNPHKEELPRTYEVDGNTELIPTPETRAALGQVGLETAEQQHDYYTRLAESLRETLESQGVQDSIEDEIAQLHSDS